MPTAFISDLHLTPERPESTQFFREFMAGASRYIDRLYILGDLFEFWIGDDGASLLGHGEVESILKDTSHKGVNIFFLHGNRDFLLGQAFADRTGCQLLPDPIVVSEQGLTILLTHGDALCIDDKEHQAARKQMLSSKWKLAFLEKPLDSRLDHANHLRAQSEISKRTKSMEIMDVNQEAVEALMRQHNVTIMIHGHTHRPAAHEFTLDGKLARRYVLGDWYTQKSAIFCEDGKMVLRR